MKMVTNIDRRITIADVLSEKKVEKRLARNNEQKSTANWYSKLLVKLGLGSTAAKVITLKDRDGDGAFWAHFENSLGSELQVRDASGKVFLNHSGSTPVTVRCPSSEIFVEYSNL